MVKLESEKTILENYLEDYKDNYNGIYFILENIAKGKYSKKKISKRSRRERISRTIFIDFIVGDKAYNNYKNLFNSKLHKRLLNLRRKIDPCFMLGYE